MVKQPSKPDEKIVSAEAPADPESLLTALRNSQETMSADVGELTTSLIALHEAIKRIEQEKIDALKVIAVERLTALNAIQAKLNEATNIIDALSQKAHEPDPFLDPKRRGYSST